MMPTVEISDSTLVLSDETMPNGEIRYRLIDRDGTGYIKTIASSMGGWQNSHAHNGIIETYVVQSGWIGIAVLDNDDHLRLSLLEKNGVWTARPGVCHNIFMGPDAITHVIKYGDGGSGDWIADHRSAQLDDLSKGVLESDIWKAGPAAEGTPR